MVGWHHRLNGQEFEQAPGDGEGQGSLACCSPRVHRVRHDWATEQQPENRHIAASAFSLPESLYLQININFFFILSSHFKCLMLVICITFTVFCIYWCKSERWFTL